MEFCRLNPYYKGSDWKTWLSERFSEALTSKLWNKKKHAAEDYRNGVKSNYVHPYLRDRSKKFTRKNKVGNTT